MAYETTGSGTSYGAGWPALWGAVIGGVGGYLVGRNSNGSNGNSGNCNGTGNGCQTCFQQGEYTGENRAGIQYTAEQVGVNAQAIRALGADMNAQFAALAQQKIADLMAEKAALQTQMVVANGNCAINNQLGLINQTLNSIVTGCGVKSYPGCCNSCGC